MSNWIYFAAKSRADAVRTFALANDRQLIVRNALNVNGDLIANVGKLQVGDRILLAYRGPDAKIELAATIAQPKIPHERALAIDRIGPPTSRNIVLDDFPLLDDDFVEVIRLSHIRNCDILIDAMELGRNTIRLLAGGNWDRTVATAFRQ